MESAYTMLLIQERQYNSGYSSGDVHVTGSYGTLSSNGVHRWYLSLRLAGSSAGTDVFTYTLSDGTFTLPHVMMKPIVHFNYYFYVNAVPVARNDTGNINVGATLTVSNSSNATDVDTATFSSSNSYNTTCQIILLV